MSTRYSTMESEGEARWYCVRTHPKHEHIAAGRLRMLEGIGVFSPVLRLRKTTRRGLVWFSEALFPNYLFARFELSSRLTEVRHAIGVSDVVHFGQRWPWVPEGQIESLRCCMAGGEEMELADDLAPGDEVTIVGRPFQGLSAVVLRTKPARERIQVLLDLLGRTTVVELSLQAVVPVGHSGARNQLAGMERAAA